MSLIIFLLALSNCTQRNPFHISGTISPEYNGQPIMLFTFENVKIRSVDTTTVVDGKFYFHGEEYKDDFSLISIGNYPDKVRSLKLILDKGDIVANITDTPFACGTYLNDALPIYYDSFRYYNREINKAEDAEVIKNLNQQLFDFKYRFKKANKDNIIGRKVYISEIHLYTEKYFSDNSINTYFDEL
ncbi:DUF4369 domain-containing protein, partial [Bacteroidales bacterium OttesenSCG-928-A17]|nr:DUF4369 domain-containing protein [Bacteroidales bacterium OttesenSCG-928-A17]